jgi:hypothetical protein
MVVACLGKLVALISSQCHRRPRLCGNPDLKPKSL